MKYNIFKTENYLIIVDDLEIKEGEYYLSKISNDVFRRSKGGHWIENYDKKTYQKVIAHLPLNNSPILEGVNLLPPLENEVDKLAEQEFPYLYQPMKGLDTTLLLREGFIEGYNKAKEKYKWTDEDVIKIVEKSRETGLTAEYFLLSLSQPKYPISFEQGNEVDNKTYTSITRRNDGFTLWIGKYIY